MGETWLSSLGKTLFTLFCSNAAVQVLSVVPKVFFFQKTFKLIVNYLPFLVLG